MTSSDCYWVTKEYQLSNAVWIHSQSKWNVRPAWWSCIQRPSKALFKIAGSVVLQPHIREWIAPFEGSVGFSQAPDPRGIFISYGAWYPSWTFTHSALCTFSTGLPKLPSLNPLWTAEHALNGHFEVSHEDASYLPFLGTAVHAISLSVFSL